MCVTNNTTTTKYIHFFNYFLIETSGLYNQEIIATVFVTVPRIIIYIIAKYKEWNTKKIEENRQKKSPLYAFFLLLMQVRTSSQGPPVKVIVPILGSWLGGVVNMD